MTDKYIDKIKELNSKRTQGFWSRGKLLMTRDVQKWTEEQKKRGGEEERSRIFANFTGEDEGRSRDFICQGRFDENLEFIAEAPTMANKLIEKDEELQSSREENQRLRDIIKEGIFNAESVISNMEDMSPHGFSTKDEELWIKQAKQALEGNK